MAHNSTPITHLLDDHKIPDTTSANSASPQATPTPLPQSPHIVSVGTTKEAGPGRATPEQGVWNEPQEQKSEVGAEQQKQQSPIRQKQQVPDIHPEAAEVGLQVAPSASPFPTIYDITVPVLTDEQIETNLHKNFWSGARWLAELCKYLLLQAHIRVKRIGGKVVRERVPERF